MATPAQIEANRANAQHSTGPRTEQGKRASASNAIRLGLSCNRLIVRPGEEQECESLREQLTAELEPTGEFQSHFFEIIVHAAWNIQRCIFLEGELQLQAFEKGSLDAMLDDELSVKLDRIYRYKKMHENSQRKAVAELRRLQSEQFYRAYQHPSAMGVQVLLETAVADAQIATAQKEVIMTPDVAALDADLAEDQATEDESEEDLQNEPIPPKFAALIEKLGAPELEEIFRRNFGRKNAAPKSEAA